MSHVINFEAASSWIYPTNYTVRKYQREIAETCLFNNTLVSLPTGMGKTLVAAVVMFNFYRWFPEGVIIFMAPTKPLVSQQILACRDIMGIRENDIAQMDGTISTTQRETLWTSKKLFFCTPQVVENDLLQGRCPAEKVVCVVIDEAHRATGNYSYVKVVYELNRRKCHFRILALSATPGADRRAVQNVLYNLHISKIEWRSEDDPDLAPYVQERVVEIIKCKASGGSSKGGWMGATKRRVNDCLREVAKKLVLGKVLLSEEPEHLNTFILNDIERNLSEGSGLRAAVQLARLLVDGRKALVDEGSAALWSVLEDVVVRYDRHTAANAVEAEFHKSGSFAALTRALRGVQESVATGQLTHRGSGQGITCENNPKLNMLQEILVDHFQSCENSRAIVFVALRTTVHDIVAELNNQTVGLRVAQFIGQGQSGSAGSKSGVGRGQSQREQEEVLKAFNRGKYNVLIATCIAEEGLDIAEVGLIVSFDVTQSPVRMLQRNGRTARKQSGRVVMLVTEGKEEEKVHKSSDSIVRVNASMMNALTSLTLSQRSPRMLPDEFTPVCREECLRTSQRSQDNRAKTTPSSSSMCSPHGSQFQTQFSSQYSHIGAAQSNNDFEGSIMSTWFSGTQKSPANSVISKSSFSNMDDTAHSPVITSSHVKYNPVNTAWECNTYSSLKVSSYSSAYSETYPKSSAAQSTAAQPLSPSPRPETPLAQPRQQKEQLCSICNRQMTVGSTMSLCGECSAVLAASLAEDDEAASSWGNDDVPVTTSFSTTSTTGSVLGVEDNAQGDAQRTIVASKKCDEVVVIEDDTVPPDADDISSIFQGLPNNYEISLGVPESPDMDGCLLAEEVTKAEEHSCSKRDSFQAPMKTPCKVYSVLKEALRPQDTPPFEKEVSSSQHPSTPPEIQSICNSLSGPLSNMTEAFPHITCFKDKKRMPPVSEPDLSIFSDINFGLFFNSTVSRSASEYEVCKAKTSPTIPLPLCEPESFRKFTAPIEAQPADDKGNSIVKEVEVQKQTNAHQAKSAPAPATKRFCIAASVFCDSSDEESEEEMHPVGNVGVTSSSDRKNDISPSSWNLSESNSHMEFTQRDNAQAYSMPLASRSPVFIANQDQMRKSPPPKIPHGFTRQQSDTKTRVVSACKFGIDDEPDSPSQYSVYTPSPEMKAYFAKPVSGGVLKPPLSQTIGNKKISRKRHLSPHHQNRSNRKTNSIESITRTTSSSSSSSCGRSCPVDDEEEANIPCAICTCCDVDENDPGVFCDGPCASFTHLSCYGLKKVPSTDKFYCDSCSNYAKKQRVLRCELCRKSGGMMRRSTCGKWTHPICVLFTPELGTDEDTMLPTSLNDLDPERDTLKCGICQRSGGANVQCCFGDCVLSFHPYCAHQKGKQMAIRCDEDGFPIYEIYCDKHRNRVFEDNIISVTVPLHTDRACDGRTPQGQCPRTNVLIKGAEDEIWNMDTESKPPRHKGRKRLRLQRKMTSTTKTPGNKENVEEAKRYAATFFDLEAGDNGASDTEVDEDSDGTPHDSFINDGEYTQAPDSVESGMAMYHALHREFEQTPSPLRSTVMYGFRGGDAGLPITNRILKECAHEDALLNTSCSSTHSSFLLDD